MAPNVQAQDSKFHVAGVKTCPVRQRPDSPDIGVFFHEAWDGCHSVCLTWDWEKNGGYSMHGWQVLIGDIFGVEQDS